MKRNCASQSRRGLMCPATRLPPHPSTTGLTTAHVGAAVSAAASEVLIALYPDFRQIVDDALRGFDFPASDPGWQFGIQVAQRALQDRSNDGSDEGGGVPEINRY